MQQAASQTVESSIKELYEYDALEPLEKIIENHVEDKSYDLSTYIYVLKLYQFDPVKVNRKTVYRILTKTLMNLPSSDFLACSYLIPTSLVGDSTVALLTNMCNALEDCDFDEFWELYQKDKGVFNDEDFSKGFAVEFADAVRIYIMDLMSVSYRDIPLSTFTRCLNSTIKKVPAFLEKVTKQSRTTGVKPHLQNWKVEGEYVVVPMAANQNREEGAKQTLDLYQLQEVLAVLT